MVVGVHHTRQHHMALQVYNVVSAGRGRNLPPTQRHNLPPFYQNPPVFQFGAGVIHTHQSGYVCEQSAA